MKFILTKAPTVEDLLVADFKQYLKDVRFGEQFPNHKNLNVSNDHPFERLMDNQGDAPDMFPSITILSSTDGEIPNMAKGWKITTLLDGDLDEINPLDWYLSDTALAAMKAQLVEKTQLHGLSHDTVWRDSASIEVWSENIGVKNDLYNLIRAYVTGPKVIDLHNATGIVIHSNTIQGQRSGYYNYDFGRVLYGGRVGFSVDYPIVQAIYDTEISNMTELEHTYREVING